MGCFPDLRIKLKKNIGLMPINLKSTYPFEPSSTAQPEPWSKRRLQSAPPSFRTRSAKPQEPVQEIFSNETRPFSAPLGIQLSGRDSSSTNYIEKEDFKASTGRAKDHLLSNPQPLPLPSPQNSTIAKSAGIFRSNTTGSQHYASSPLPLPPLSNLRHFSYDEISAACQNFSLESCLSEGLSSTSYKASFGEENGGRKFEATITLFLPSTQSQDMKGFVNETSLVASIQHPQLCKLIGYHGSDAPEKRVLVYEKLFHGSLDSFHCRRSDGVPMDWWARMKVALCAAHGLAYLHEEGPLQAAFCDFSSTNIQVDKDFSAKLCGYGRILRVPDVNITNMPTVVASLPEETIERGLLTPKSNVWCFGVVLLELLAGRRHLDPRIAKEERDIIKWTRPFLSDDSRLPLIMDPRLNGRYPLKAARIMADTAKKCLQKDPSARPTMRAVVESLQDIQDIKYSCRFRLEDPPTLTGNELKKSPSLSGVIALPPRLSLTTPLPARPSHSVSPSRHSESTVPLSRTCSYSACGEENHVPRAQRPSPCRTRRVEGF